jgi:hypothetical protein
VGTSSLGPVIPVDFLFPASLRIGFEELKEPAPHSEFCPPPNRICCRTRHCSPWPIHILAALYICTSLPLSLSPSLHFSLSPSLPLSLSLALPLQHSLCRIPSASFSLPHSLYHIPSASLALPHSLCCSLPCTQSEEDGANGREQGSIGAKEKGSKGAKEKGSKGAREQGSKRAREQRSKGAGTKPPHEDTQTLRTS